MEIDHLEGESFSSKVGLIPKSDRQVNLSEGFSLLPWDNAMERHPSWLDV
jgi:hypothetical protein